jgi:hypothetical protein
MKTTTPSRSLVPQYFPHRSEKSLARSAYACRRRRRWCIGPTILLLQTSTRATVCGTIQALQTRMDRATRKQYQGSYLLHPYPSNPVCIDALYPDPVEAGTLDLKLSTVRVEDHKFKKMNNGWPKLPNRRARTSSLGDNYDKNETLGPPLQTTHCVF